MQPRRLFAWILTIATLGVTAVLMETVLRKLDGLPLAALRLPEHGTHATIPASRGAADQKYLAQVKLARGVDPQWYRRDPAPHTMRPLSPALAARYERYKNVDLTPAFRVWNRIELAEQVCNASTRAAYAPYDDFFVFDPPAGTPYPPYRHLPDVDVPGWFHANQFGWRGADLELNKPPETIRIAFLGSSKTMDGFGTAFSHIEYIGEWLNLWLQATGRHAHVEMINAARIGVSERSTAPILLEEVLPLEPDLVIDDGSNDFAPILLVQTAHDPPAKDGPVFTPGGAWPADAYLALSRHIHTLTVRLRRLDGSEPRKPVPRINWPAGVDEFHPDPMHVPLPMDIHLLFGFYDRMRPAIRDEGGEFALPSWVWMAREGLTLDLTRDLNLYNYINSRYYPLSYAQLARARDFYNRAFHAYADHYHMPFFDIASVSPLDPELFVDAVHMTQAGLRLEAWNWVQLLIPWLEAQIERGDLPRPMRHRLDRHPSIPREYPLVSRAELQRSCH
jgi:hypothetical protein